MIILITTLAFLSALHAQTNKPRQLRNEVLQSKAKEENRSSVKKPRKNLLGTPGTTVLKPANPAAGSHSSPVHLEQSAELSYDQFLHPGIQILKGNVRFRHDNALLYCDSAYFYEAQNSFDAFSNVRIVQGDTLTVYGDFLNYDGNTKLAKLWNNVKMVNRNTVLTTNTLYYNRYDNLAYYNTGGVIEDGKNTLTSMWGEYSPATKIALFKDQVKLTNPESDMNTDTLKYNTSSSVADIVGNSLIVYKKETDIYSQRGWYDTKNDRMMLLDRSLVEQTDGKTLVGDTIFYDKKKKYGEAFSNVELNDPKQKSTLTGNFVSYDEISHTGLAADSALLIDWSSRDSLFMSADTLYTMKDSLTTDTVAYNMVKAFKNVRFFRKDVQGMCDSLFYNTRDSVLHLQALPVLWSDNNQLMGHTITAFTKNKKVDRVLIQQSGIAIQKDSLDFYNQLSGKEITAYLDSGQLKKVYVNGNAETIYFPKDEKTKEYIGVNKTLSSYVNMYFKDKKVQRIVLTTASSGAMYPLSQMGENDLYLRNFYWYDKERPQKPDDVFTKFIRTEPPKRPESSKRPSFPGENNGNAESTNAGKQTNTGSKTNGNNNNSFNPNGSGVNNPLNSLNRKGNTMF
ncbi:MAG: OstA-like protein [Paludibacteraceae bacterium]